MILFVGSNTLALRNAAIQHNSSAQIIFHNDIINISNIDVGYVTICDHKLSDFIYIISCADEIYYIDADWDSADAKLITELHLRLASHKIIVHNISKIATLPDQMLALADNRKGITPQLWAAGCSFTYGSFVDTNERWGALIGEQLNLPVSFLAQPAASVQWAADQILRSDIQKDDIVIWGITGASRFPYYSNNSISHVCQSYYDNNKSFNSLINERVLVSDHMTYCSITAIEQVILHSQHIGYQLILMQFPLNIESHELIMLDYLSQFEFFVHVYNSSEDKFIDYGIDNSHPGPQQHAYYANAIINFMQLNKVDLLT